VSWGKSAPKSRQSLKNKTKNNNIEIIIFKFYKFLSICVCTYMSFAEDFIIHKSDGYSNM